MQKLYPIVHSSILIILIMSLFSIYKNYILSHQQLFASTQMLGINITPSVTPTITPTPTPLPVAPSVSAASYQIKQVNGDYILSQDPHTPRPPASTTKIMTALITLESYPLNQVVIVPEQTIIGSQVGLEAGEKQTVENLLYALLLASANDAAATLANQSPYGYQNFIERMNQKASQLSLNQTHYVNATGLDDPEQQMSAHDLTTLTEYALSNPIFAQTVNLKSIEIIDIEQTNPRQLTNRNELLFEDLGVTGVKTGTTDAAGQVLVTSLERLGQTYIIVVMGSADRYADTRALISWIDQYLGLAPIPTITPTPTATPTLIPENLTPTPLPQ